MTLLVRHVLVLVVSIVSFSQSVLVKITLDITSEDEWYEEVGVYVFRFFFIPKTGRERGKERVCISK